MIRNIVFDMGNVLLHYLPEEFLRTILDDEEDVDLLHRELFLSQEWADLDAGMIEEGEALEKVLGRVPQRLHDSLRDTMARWCENLPPIEEVYHLAQELKEKGYRLYLLSNASTRFHEFKHTIPAIALMDGCLISADVKLAKPSPAVYQKLLELHNLKAEECYFIDDNPQNVEAARGEGFDGFVFTGDIDALRRDMARKGILEA